MEKLIFPLSAKEAQKMGVAYSEVDNRGALFPTRLRLLRNEKGISQEALSKALGVTKSTISLYENGENVPDIKTLSKIAAYYGVSYDYLMGESDSQVREYHDLSDSLGLSDKAIEVLRLYKKKLKGKYLIPVVNYLIEQEYPNPDWIGWEEQEDWNRHDAWNEWIGLVEAKQQLLKEEAGIDCPVFELCSHFTVLKSIEKYFRANLKGETVVSLTEQVSLKAEPIGYFSREKIMKAILFSEIQDKLKELKVIWDVEHPED